MRILLKYLGKQNEILYPPLVLLSLADILYKNKYDVVLIQDDEDFDYLGVPSDNPTYPEYKALRDYIQKLTNIEISDSDLYNLKVNYDLCPYFDIPLIVTAYGCKYNCPFCTKLDKGKIILRDINTVKEELKWITDRYDYFEFGDCNVFLNPENFFNIINFIPEGVRWGALINIDNYPIENLYYLYKKGCRNIYVGVESFNPKDLEYLKKPYYLKNINPKKFLILLKELGFNVHVYLIRGLPNQTRLEWIETIEWLTEHGISYTSNTYFDISKGEEVLETKNLSREYLEVKKDEDYIRTNKNLYKFLDKYINRL